MHTCVRHLQFLTLILRLSTRDQAIPCVTLIHMPNGEHPLPALTFSPNEGAPPLQDLPGMGWLGRGRAKTRVGIACRLPDCPTVVLRPSTGGQRPWFCGTAHRLEFFRRGVALRDALAELETRAAEPQNSRTRRRLLSDALWLREVYMGQYGGAERAPQKRDLTKSGPSSEQLSKATKGLAELA